MDTRSIARFARAFAVSRFLILRNLVLEVPIKATLLNKLLGLENLPRPVGPLNRTTGPLRKQ